MAKLELPVRSFVESFCKQAFPDRDWSRGTAISDLVIKANSAIMQPLRQDIDTIKINQSATNWRYMTRDAMDGLAANWGKFRQSGSRSTGTARLYFDTATDYRLTYLEFYTTDGTTFLLAAPTNISTTDLLQNRQSDGGFYFDIAVISQGVGNAYALPAGSLVGIRNPPAGITKVEQITDFAVTAPDETNFDVVNSMYRNLGLRNFVSKQSIRAPIYDSFPGVLDVYVTGAGDAKMVRDLVSFDAGTGIPTTIHVGGMTDVWVNTINLNTYQTVFSYLPSSLKLSLVSAKQAQTSQVIFTDATSVVTTDGSYLYGGSDVLDESSAVVYDQNGLAVNAFPVGVADANARYTVANRDLVLGDTLLVMPPKGSSTGSQVLLDPLGTNFGAAGCRVGDTFIWTNGLGATDHAARRRIVDLGERSVRLAPAAEGALTGGGAFSSIWLAGTRSFPYAPAAPPVGCRVVVASGAARGHYRLLGNTGGNLTIGNVKAAGSLVPVSSASGVYTYQYRGAMTVPGAAAFSGTFGGAVTGVTISDSTLAAHAQAGQVLTSGAYQSFVLAVAGSVVTLDVAMTASGGAAYSLWTPTYAAPELPSDFTGAFTAACSGTWATGATIVPGNPGAYVAGVTHDVSVTGVTRTSTGVFFTVAASSFVGPYCTATVLVEGFRGATAIGDTWFVEADSTALDTPTLVTSYANTNTLFASSLAATLAAGSPQMVVPGIGLQSNAGDLVVFENPGTLSDQQIMESGTDGQLWTTYISGILDDNTITLGAAVPVDIPVGTRYVVQRNQRLTAVVNGTMGSGGATSTLAAGASTFTFTGADTSVSVGDRIFFAYPYHNLVPPPNGTDYLYAPTVVSKSGAVLTLSPPVPGVPSGTGFTTGIPTATPFTVYHDAMALTSLRVTAATNGGLAIAIGPNGANPTWPQGLGDGSGLVLRVTNPTNQKVSFNHIRFITGSLTRTLSFTPPVSVRTLTLAASGSSGAPTALPGDIGNAVVQAGATGVIARGVLKAYDNVAGTWVVAPNSGADVFSTVSGNTIAVAGRVAFTVTAVGSATPFGYTTPQVTDIGKTVIQGTYRGTLSAYDNTLYTWTIQPFADTDVFDDLSTTVFVDTDGSGTLNGSEGNGVLRIASTTNYSTLSGTLHVTLNSAFPFDVVPSPGVLTYGQVPECYVDVLSRIPVTGGLVDDTAMRLCPDISFNPDNLGGSTGLTEKQLVPLGTNVGLYTAGNSTSTPWIYTFPTALTPLYLALPNAPAELTVSVSGTVSAGAATITFPGSALGYWAFRGRALRLTVNGATRFYALNSPHVSDSPDLLRLDSNTPIQTTLLTTSIITAQVVHGYVLPFFRVSTTPQAYRVIRPPTLAETEVSSVNGVEDLGAQRLTDATQDFTSLVGYTDSATSALYDDWLNLDSGADASLVPTPILSVPYANALQLGAGAVTATAAGIQYHLTRRSNDVSAEGWFVAALSTTSVTVADPDPTNQVNPIGHAAWLSWKASVVRYYSAARWHLHAVSDASAATAWEVKHLPIASVAFPTNQVVFTLDTAYTNTTLQPNVSSVWTAGTGFAAGPVAARICMRAADRVMARNVKAIGVQTYNYYLSNYLTLPLVRILAVEQLDRTTLQPVKTLDYSFVVPADKAGLRYSANEQNEIIINDAGAAQQPVRLTYVADSSIEGINNFITGDDVRVLDSNQLVKRMETVAIDLSVTVRSTLTSQALVQQIAGYINTLPSTAKVSKDGIIQFLYAGGSVTGVDTSSFVLAGTYYPAENGYPVSYLNVSEVFGAPTACYISGNISVTVTA